MAEVAGLLAEIAEIGLDPGTGGYRRLAYTREDAELTQWFDGACRARGLDVVADRCGNQWAWWGDPDAVGAGVVTGSHLDSVPDGGAFDGPLGVCAALAAVDRLRGNGFRPARPIGLVRFRDEEGARFGLACAGSRLLTGQARADDVLGLRDADGVAYAEALGAAGIPARQVGPDAEALSRIGAFVEVHVEQGVGLAEPATSDDGGSPIGVATMIHPHGRWRYDLRGRADHAGTARLDDRHDPMLDLARLVLSVRAAATSRDAVTTVGKVDVRPNAVNAIPSLVTAWLDARAGTQAQVQAVVDDLSADGFIGRCESWTDAIAFPAALRDRLAALCGAALDLPGPVPALDTGAGHDAGVLAAAGVPAGMLFVRNPTGVSHSPAEHAPAADCEASVAALAAVLADLAGPQAAIA